MQHFDTRPLYRSSVGFDRLFTLLDGLSDSETTGYPPYNIERLEENRYTITMAIAGFSESEITIEAKENLLFIKGDKSQDESVEHDYLHRGIAERAFERRFQLADYVEIVSANLENGLLHIDLVREIPEAKRTRQIAITSKKKSKSAAKSQKTLEA